MDLDTMWTLPEKEAMEARLVEACDNAHVRQKLYPRLLLNAGQERAAIGINLNFELAAYDYLDGMPPQMHAVFDILAPELLRAFAGSDAAYAAVLAIGQGRGE